MDHIEQDIDWTGVKPDQSPIAPLDSSSFLERLRLLSERASGLMTLRKAFKQRQSHENRFAS